MWSLWQWEVWWESVESGQLQLPVFLQRWQFFICVTALSRYAMPCGRRSRGPLSWVIKKEQRRQDVSVAAGAQSAQATSLIVPDIMAGQPDILQLRIAQLGENFSGTCPHALPLPVVIRNNEDRVDQTPTERCCCSVFMKLHHLPLNARCLNAILARMTSMIQMQK